MSSSFISKYFGEFLGKVESFFDKCHPFNIRVQKEVFIYTGIYWLFENATTCMVIFHIDIYGVISYSATVAV